MLVICQVFCFRFCNDSWANITSPLAKISRFFSHDMCVTIICSLGRTLSLSLSHLTPSVLHRVFFVLDRLAEHFRGVVVLGGALSSPPAGQRWLRTAMLPHPDGRDNGALETPFFARAPEPINRARVRHKIGIHSLHWRQRYYLVRCSSTQRRGRPAAAVAAFGFSTFETISCHKKHTQAK